MKRHLTILAAAASVVAATACQGREDRPTPSAASIDSIASPAAPGSAEPNLDVAPDGRVFMSWLEPADSGHALRFASHDGATWTPARTIVARRDFFVNWADFPSLVVLDSQRLAAHWLQRNGTGTYAYGVQIAQSSDDGETWGKPVMAHRDSSQTEHGFVAMWRDSGTVGAVWLDGRKFKPAGHQTANATGHDLGNEMMLVSTTLSPDGTRGAEVRLDERTCDCCQNAAAVTSRGPIVAYRNRSHDEIRDIYVTRRIAGKWSPGTAVHDDNWKIAACPVNGPALAADGERVAIAWFTAAHDTARVKVAFSNDAGANFGTPIHVDGGNPAGRVDIAMLADGAALVTWIERIGGDTAAVRVRRVLADGKAGAPVTIASSSAARASGFPQMAITGTNVVFAWTMPGRPSAIRVARASVSTIP